MVRREKKKDDWLREREGEQIKDERENRECGTIWVRRKCGRNRKGWCFG